MSEALTGDVVARAAFEAQGIDELLELLVASPLAVPESIGAAIVSVPGETSPFISHAKYFPEQISQISFQLEEILSVARQSQPTVCDPTLHNFASQILALKPEASAAVISPLRLRGNFYGVLVLAVGSKVPFSDDGTWKFVLQVITLATARFLHDGKKGPSSRKSQSDARLTDRQLSITDFALRGLSNRDIAQELHLSLGTVKVELGKIYRKLEISARSHLYMPHSDIQLR